MTGEEVMIETEKIAAEKLRSDNDLQNDGGGLSFGIGYWGLKE